MLPSRILQNTQSNIAPILTRSGSDLDLDVGALAQLLQPDLRLLVHLVAEDLLLELILHLGERAHRLLLVLEHLEHVEAARAADGAADLALAHGEQDLLPLRRQLAALVPAEVAAGPLG